MGERDAEKFKAGVLHELKQVLLANFRTRYTQQQVEAQSSLISQLESANVETAVLLLSAFAPVLFKKIGLPQLIKVREFLKMLTPDSEDAGRSETYSSELTSLIGYICGRHDALSDLEEPVSPGSQKLPGSAAN